MFIFLSLEVNAQLNSFPSGMSSQKSTHILAQGKPYESVLKIQFCVIFLYLNAALRLSHYIIGET